jgi:hypothetical protein
VMSISSGAVTTGTPLTTVKGKLPSRICVTSCGREHGLRPLIAAARQVAVPGLPLAGQADPIRRYQLRSCSEACQ